MQDIHSRENYISMLDALVGTYLLHYNNRQGHEDIHTAVLDKVLADKPQIDQNQKQVLAGFLDSYQPIAENLISIEDKLHSVAHKNPFTRFFSIIEYLSEASRLLQKENEVKREALRLLLATE